MVALGPVGRNVAAGMTGGLGYFFDEEGDFPNRVNGEIVAIQRVQTEAGAAHLRGLIEAHVERTGEAARRGGAVRRRGSAAVLEGPPQCGACIRLAWPLRLNRVTRQSHRRPSTWRLPPPPPPPSPAGSAKGQAILADWSNALQKFWQLVPPSESNTPQASKAAEDAVGSGVVGGVAVAATA